MKSRLIRWLALPVLAISVGFAPQAIFAQTDDYDDLYEEDQYDVEETDDNLSLGIGIGLVKPDGDGEIYYSAALRFRIGKRDRHDEDMHDGRKAEPVDDYNRRHNTRHRRGRGGSNDGIRGYLEPEISFWSRNADDPGEVDEEDLYFGLNLIGVVPTHNADFFFGAGFGLHSTDTQVFDDNGNLVDESDSRLGGNVQFGVDINMGDNWSLFGLGRLDLLEDRPNDRQSKVQVGLRFKF